MHVKVITVDKVTLLHFGLVRFVTFRPSPFVQDLGICAPRKLLIKIMILSIQSRHSENKSRHGQTL